jgi:hypothetical protein
MSTLNTITAHLFKIRQTLVSHPVFARGSGVAVDDPANVREAEELERLSDSLDLLLRNLRNHQPLLSAREQGLWNIPRDRRYAAASSVGQEQADVQRLMQAANELRRLLDDLLRRNGTVSEGDVADKVGEFVKQWYERAHASQHSTEVGHNPGAPSYLPPGQFQASPEAATIAVYAALRALAYFMKRKKGKAA